jgi:amino acid permease
MVWLIQFFILCALFTLLVIPAQLRDPVSQIASYPPVIRARVMALPQYSEIFRRCVKKGVAKKIAAAALLSAVFAGIAYFSGARTFGQAFDYSFSLFLGLSLYDLYVLDLIVFRYSKRLRIQGTEDMEAEYRNPIHHIIGFAKSVAIGALVSIVSAGFVSLANRYIQ